MAASLRATADVVGSLLPRALDGFFSQPPSRRDLKRGSAKGRAPEAAKRSALISVSGPRDASTSLGLL